MTPKVFVSYSWNSTEHQLLIKSWVDQLINDGIEVIFDLYDLNEGDDKYAFMEKMVNDVTVSNVLIMCDKLYTQKANNRKAGVGTESQIISKEVYEHVEQSKFIPIVTEFNEKGEPYLPIFLNDRIYIDFSSPDAVIRNWEQLIRDIFKKPLYVKPEIGKAPFYITEEISTPKSNVQIKLDILKHALSQKLFGIENYRKDFFESCITTIEIIRDRERPKVDSIGERIIEDYKQLLVVRNQIVDWILFEGNITDNITFSGNLIDLLEIILNQKWGISQGNSWNDTWENSYSLFIYDTFLYTIAGLIKCKNYLSLHEIFSTSYYSSQGLQNNRKTFNSFESFTSYNLDELQKVLAPEGKILRSTSAEVIYRNCDRNDITFTNLIEADLLAFFFSLLKQENNWRPQTYYYNSYSERCFPLFIRAEQHKYFKNLSTIIGINDVEKLRIAINEGFLKKGLNHLELFMFTNLNILFNLDKLDSIE